MSNRLQEVEVDASDKRVKFGDSTKQKGSSNDGRSTEVNSDNEFAPSPARIKTVQIEFLELIFHLIYTGVLLAVVFTLQQPAAYYMTSALKSEFLERRVLKVDDSLPGSPMVSFTFSTMKGYDDFWKYVQVGILQSLYREEYDGIDESEEDEKTLARVANKLIGLPRIRMQRAKNGSCSVHKFFKDIVNSCYAPFSLFTPGVQDKEPLAGQSPTGSWAYDYMSSSATGSLSYMGEVAWYNGGGYVVELPAKKVEAEEVLNVLAASNYLTHATRIIFVEFVLYNVQIDHYSVVRLVVEFPAAGGIIATHSIRTPRMPRYDTSLQKISWVLQLTFAVLNILLIVIYCILCFMRRRRGESCFNFTPAGVIDPIIFLTGFATSLILIVLFFGVDYLRMMGVDKAISSSSSSLFYAFETLSLIQLFGDFLMAITAFLCFLKFLKYLGITKGSSQLTRTLTRSSSDLLAFLVIFFIVLLAFAQLGYVIFHQSLSGFRTFGMALFSLFLVIMGDFRFSDMLAAHRTIGPIYFILFVIFVFFILFSFFLAIISDTYVIIRTESAGKPEFHLVDLFKHYFNRLFYRKKILEAENKAYDQWRSDMINRGNDPERTDQFIKKHRHVGSGPPSPGQLLAMQVQLEHDYPVHMSSPTNDVTSTSQTVEGRLTQLQKNIADVMQIVEQVINKAEESKLKRQEAMTQLLDNIVKMQEKPGQENTIQMEQMIRAELRRMKAM